MVSRTGANAIQAQLVGGFRFTAPPATSGVLKKWRPGHYCAFNRGLSAITPAGYQLRQAIYQAEANIPQVRGYMMYVPWSQFETAFNQYTISPIQQDLNFLAGIGKCLAVEILDDIFSVNSASSILPAYLYTPGQTGYTSAFNPGFYTGSTTLNNVVKGVTRAALWVTAVQQRAAALLAWLASPSGGNLDAHPALESINFDDESTVSAANIVNWSNYPTYSLQGWVNGQIAIASAIGAAFQQTNCTLQYNWMAGASDAVKASIASAMAAQRVGFSGPDTLPHATTTSSVAGSVAGTDGVACYTGEIGGVDYRGKLPAMWQVQSPDYYPYTYGGSGSNPSGLVQNIFAYVNNTLRSTHVFWGRVSPNPVNQADWQSSVLPFIRANPLSNSACPSLYSGCNTAAA